MEDKLKKLLLSFDDKEECEFPENFNYTNEMGKIHTLKKQIENVIKKELIIDEYVQDASFFTELMILEKIQNERKNNGESFVNVYDLSIRFSAFGNMFTILSDLENDIYNKYPIEKIVDILKNNGYIYINSELLDEPYDGINKYLCNENTWFTRYFDYI